MGAYKTRQASGKFHHIVRLYINIMLNFHLSQDNNERDSFFFWESQKAVAISHPLVV
jgi:hypothetical protein